MSGVDDAQVANEPISLPDDGLQKSRIVGVIAKGCAYLSDDVIYVALGIDKQVGTPKLRNDVFAGYQLLSPAHKKNEQLHGLLFQPHLTPVAAQFVTAKVELNRV
ncbi:MAG: hypothetical protein WA715_04190 [Candidatus Acidiferrum sp.]|jgi:hypothetical protein